MSRGDRSATTHNPIANRGRLMGQNPGRRDRLESILGAIDYFGRSSPKPCGLGVCAMAGQQHSTNQQTV